MNKPTATNLLNAGAIGSAIAASICCLGPVALAVLGLGGGTLLLKFEPYRSYFLAATAIFLGAAFYLTYHTSAPDNCEPGSACASPRTRKAQKVTLWVVTVIVVLVAAFPYLSRVLF